jgi:hypothetical protein
MLRGGFTKQFNENNKSIEICIQTINTTIDFNFTIKPKIANRKLKPVFLVDLQLAANCELKTAN